MNRPTIRQCLREAIRTHFGDRAEEIIEDAEDSGRLEEMVDDALLAVTRAADTEQDRNVVEAEEIGLQTFMDGADVRIAALETEASAH